MKEFYLDISEKIMSSTAFAEASLVPIQHIDLYGEQYTSPEQEEVFENPALFFEFSLRNDDSYRKPTTLMTIVTHLLVQSLETSAVRRDLASRPSLDIYRYRSILQSLMVSCGSDSYSRPRYQSGEHITRLGGGLVVLREQYTCLLYEEQTLEYILQQAPDNAPVSIKIQQEGRAIVTGLGF